MISQETLFQKEVLLLPSRNSYWICQKKINIIQTSLFFVFFVYIILSLLIVDFYNIISLDKQKIKNIFYKFLVHNALNTFH